MFNFTREYFYGEGTDNVIRLTPAEASAVNKCRITNIRTNPDGSMSVQMNLTDKEIRHYNRAADKLNEYNETHAVFARDDFLENNDILRPVK